MSNKNSILFPVGRMVMGSLYTPQTKNADGKLLTFSKGPQAGQPRVSYFFAVAIKKNETHWNTTEWGSQVFALGKQFFPAAHLSLSFAWKIVDGDSQTPNMKGIAPASREGYLGHWVVTFTNGFASKLYSRDGKQEITEPNAALPGDYIQVYANVGSNNSQSNPGIYINHQLVALAGFGEKIKVAFDAENVGFGNAPLPTGATSAPVTNSNWVQHAPVSAVPPVSPTPHYGILNVPHPPAKKILVNPALGPVTFEELVNAGWTEQKLLAEGHISYA